MIFLNMERIGFSLAGEGRGHAARVVALSQILNNRYDIVYFCPETVQTFIRKHIPKPVIITVPALNFVKNGHGIDYVGTLRETLKRVKTLKRDISDLAEHIRCSEISALISDFEPYASWAAAICDVPVLNLNHPGVILKFLSFSPGAWVARSVAAFMMPPAQRTIICSFYRGDVGPILRKEIRKAQVRSGDYFLVYTKDSSRVRMQETLSRFTDVQFRVFPNSEEDFTQALAGCRGVIAPAGHQLISESLFLGKPVLAIPQSGQFEQRLNARMLKLSGRGDRGRFRTLDKDLRRFIDGIAEYPHAERGLETFRYDDDTERTAGMIVSFLYENTSAEPTRRKRFTWYRTIPEKIEVLKTLPVRMPA
jgi:uncharacterized protein (TIGR00661 family)